MHVTNSAATADPPASTPVPGTLEHWARTTPDAVAVVDGENSMTFSQLNELSNRVATALEAAGIGPGAVVVVRTQVRIEWSVVASAIAKVGASLLGMNWRLTPTETKYVLNNSRAEAVICDDEDPAALLAAFGDTPLKLAVTLDVPAQGFVRYADLIAREGRHFQSAGDPPLVIYTSGTTGLPKGVVMERPKDARTLEYLMDVRSNSAPQAGDVYLVAMPMHHGSGPNQMWSALRNGCKAVLLRRFDPLKALELMQAHRVTHFTGVPTMYKRMAALPEQVVARYDVSTLRSMSIGAAPVSDELKTWIGRVFGGCLSEGYGSTETGMISRMPAGMHERKPGSSGKPHKHVNVEIRDDEGKVLPAGKTGEIWVDTPVVIRNYLNAPALDTDTLDQRGFFRTGDVGRLDEDGYLYISDRAKDMIISGGVNIYPAEIEHALLTHPAVADAAVIGVPDAEFGESVMAFCEIKPGRLASVDELLAHCTGILASYKRPKTLRIVDELPRNTVGKILKRDLRAPYWKDQVRKV